MKICHCARFAFIAARVEVVVGGDHPGPVWVCDHCNGVHHYPQEHSPDVKRGPKDAIGPLGSIANESGQMLTTWATKTGHVKIVEFRTYPRVVPMADRKPMIFTTWEILQSKVALILAEPAGPSDNALEAVERQQARYEARGIAEVLAVLMSPFMDPPEGSTRSAADMVVKHAVSYYKDNDYEVPGLGAHLWDASLNADGSPRVAIEVTKAKAAPTRTAARPKAKKPEATLSDKDKEGIRSAVTSGMFTPEKIAPVYGVSVATVQALLT